MTTTRRSLPIALGTLALLGACAGAPTPDESGTGGAGYPLTVDDCGTTATIEQRPERAVTMNQGATEVALALGLQDRLIGTAYLDNPVAERWSDAYESVDVLSDAYPDQESLLSAEPDFVYASYGSAFEDEEVAGREELADLGVGTYTSPLGCRNDEAPTAVTFESVWDEIDTVAEVFGVPERAEEIRAEQEDLLAELTERADGDGLDVFWFDSGDKAAFAGVGEGGPQLVLDAVGATNVFADVDGEWADVPWEDVVAADPDVIVLADASWSSVEEKKKLLADDPALRGLTAVAQERYVELPFSASTPGVRLAEGAETVAKQLAELG
ncbi:ABC transporter substrate-binding protein [Aeromicrobium sp. CF4.19]|uniref:ABC transporter substrate-binding protein n=1 Tax=Aeromicrobium sp. CF4.19 TaxID=3373082 RepID=UPI003EE7D1E1